MEPIGGTIIVPVGKMLLQGIGPLLSAVNVRIPASRHRLKRCGRAPRTVNRIKSPDVV